MARRDRRNRGNGSNSPPPGGGAPDAVRRSMEALMAQVAYDEEIDTTERGWRSKALRERGHELSRQGLHHDAHRLYVEAARLFEASDEGPAAAICWYDLGQSYEDLTDGVREENLRHARELFERALCSPARQRTPLRYALTHDALGRVHRALAEHAHGDEARRLLTDAEAHYVQACRAAEATGPLGFRDAAGYHHNLGNLHLQRRRYDEAERHYRRAIGLLDETKRDPIGFARALPPQRLPLEPVLWLALARLHVERGRRGELPTAIRALEALLGEAPPPSVAADAHLLAAKACMKLAPAQREDAQRHLRAIDRRSLSSDHHRLYVESLQAAGESDIARRVLRQLVDEAMARRAPTLADHVSDHAAREAQDYAVLAAHLHLEEGRPVEAFLALEETAALRYMERVFTHAGSGTDPVGRALGVWHGAFAPFAIVLEQMAAVAAHEGDEAGRHACEEARRHCEAVAPPEVTGVPIVDTEGPRAYDTARRVFLDALRGAARSPSVVTALRGAARAMADEAQRISHLFARRDREAHESRQVQATALDAGRLHALLHESPDEVLVRVHIERDFVAVAVWLDEGELTARGLRRDLTREQGEALKSLHLVACGIPTSAGGDDERVTEALECLLPALDLAEVLPEGRCARVVVLPSRLAALVPWAAAGVPGATLLDRAEAIAYLPNLAPRVIRQQVVVPRSGTLLVAPGEHCDEQPTRFHDVAFADRAEGEDVLLGEHASCEAVLRAAGRSDVVSVYSHGLHRAGEGAEIALAGESLSLATLGGEWAGCERVELWACQSGVNVPTAPLIPWVDEAFGIDVEFHYAGVRSTVSTLWSVPAFVTAHIVRRYRKSLAAHGDPARALADAQRWWRDEVLAALPALLARTPEAELPGAVTALLGARVTHDDLTATLGPLRVEALLPPAAQRHVVRMFSSPEAWAGFRFLGVAGRRPEVVPDDARRALTADERATLDALLQAPPARARDIDALDRERLDALRDLSPTASPTSKQALEVARAYAERGLGAMRHNLLRAAAWVHEALAAPSCTDDERLELRLEAAWLWTEIARGELDTEVLRPLYPADPVLVGRAQSMVDACGQHPTAAVLRAWVELLSRRGNDQRVPDPAVWRDVRRAVEATTAPWPRLRAAALALEWLLAQHEVTDALAHDALALADAVWPEHPAREHHGLLARVRSTRAELALRLGRFEAPPSPYEVTAREIVRGLRWMNRAHATHPDAHVDPQREISTALDRLEGKHWGMLNDGLDDFWDTSGLPGPAWQMVTGGFFTDRFMVAPEPRLALHHVASLQLGADLRLGAIHRSVRLAPHGESIPDPGELAWRREAVLQRLEDLARLPRLGAPRTPSPHDAFRLPPAGLLDAGQRAPDGLTGWDAMEMLGAAAGSHPAARTGAFLLERAATHFDGLAHESWSDLRAHLEAMEAQVPQVPVEGGRRFLERLAPQRRIADLEESLRDLPRELPVLGVSIGGRGEVLMSLCARGDDGLHLRTAALATGTGWEARDALVELLSPQSSDDGPTASVDSPRTAALRRLCACFEEALARCLDGLTRTGERTLRVFAPGPLRGLPWGALTVGGVALRDRFAAVTSLPWLGFEGKPPPEEGDGSRVLCALGAGNDLGETRFGACAIRTLRSLFPSTAAAEPIDRARGTHIVETERLEQLADRVEVVRWYGLGYASTLNASTEGMALAFRRTLSPRNLLGTLLPRCHRVEFWAATGGLGACLATLSSDRDVVPALVWSALAAGARGVLDLAWPVHDLVKALVCERFGVLAARGDVSQSVALGEALRDVDALLQRWRGAASFESARAALAWLDGERRANALQHGLDPTRIVPFASVEASGALGDLRVLMEAVTAPEQLAAFRWWGT